MSMTYLCSLFSFLVSVKMSVTFKFVGFMAPVFTPFHDDAAKSLNLKVIEEYANFLKLKNIYGVLVNGTSGEATSQTVEEREQVAEEWIRVCKETGQTVVIQVGGTCLKNVQRLAAHAEKNGAAAILCLADLFHRPKNADDLLHYLKLVSQSAPNIPLLYYHLPDFTGISVDVVDLLEKARGFHNLVGIKFTSNNLEMGIKCLSVAGGKYTIFLGSDTLLLPAFSMGFSSVIGTTLNMMAAHNLDIQEKLVLQDVESARKIQKKLNEAVKCITKHGTWVTTMKTAMNMLTPISVGPVREPLTALSDEQAREILEDLTELNYLS